MHFSWPLFERNNKESCAVKQLDVGTLWSKYQRKTLLWSIESMYLRDGTAAQRGGLASCPRFYFPLCCFHFYGPLILSWQKNVSQEIPLGCCVTMWHSNPARWLDWVTGEIGFQQHRAVLFPQEPWEHCLSSPSKFMLLFWSQAYSFHLLQYAIKVKLPSRLTWKQSCQQHLVITVVSHSVLDIKNHNVLIWRAFL